jgi:PEP-CTERM motif
VSKKTRSALHRYCLTLGLVTAAMAAGGTAGASVFIEVAVQGNNVVASGSGSLNLDALTYQQNDNFSSWTNPRDGDLFVGNPGISGSKNYHGISGPASIGSGGFIVAGHASGQKYGVWAGLQAVLVPAGYISGSDLGASTATWYNATLHSLGLTPGTYTWTWGSHTTADSLTIQIDNAIPEPASLTLLAGALAGMAGFRRRV